MKTEDGGPKKNTEQIIRDYIPAHALDYCLELIGRHNFRFILRKERQTKLGDFRRDKYKNYTITVNRNLNPYQFLVTFIHEFAHLEVAVEHPRSIKAHGREWKQSFKHLMLPLLNADVFPDDILRPLARHMRNPKAAASSDPVLWKALQQHNSDKEGTTLADIRENERFIFKKRLFIRLQKRRTRILCTEVNSGKQYLIPEIAEVELVV